MGDFIFKVGGEIDDGDSFERAPEFKIVNESSVLKSINSILFYTDTASYTQYFWNEGDLVRRFDLDT